jgi:dihydrodipicolinate synthase/N-acetylneuraminate lyase
MTGTAASAGAIQGTWGTLLLPLADDDSICWTRLTEQVDAYIAAGVAGIYSNGTACEFHTQTEDEFDRLHQILAERCARAGVPWQAGASHMSAQTSRERARRVAPLRPRAIQVVLPDWFPVTNVEAIRFLSGVAEAAAPVPLVLYNPPHAKRSLAPADFGELARAVPALAGVKVPHSAPDWCREFRRACPGLSLFVPGHELASGIIHGGAHGAYSNVACLSPSGAVRWNRQIYDDPCAALALERRIQDFLTAHVLPFRAQGISNPGLDKLLAAAGGWSSTGTRLRWPYSWIPEEEAVRLSALARRDLPELFTE